jgi:lysophospholipase L1-like esterase
LIACAALCALALLAGCGSMPTSNHASRRTTQHGVGTATPGITYVALGASDAFGVGTVDADRDNWPTVLAGDLGGHVHLVNLGIPGATVAEATRDELPIALDAHPDIVTVWLAVNDLVDGVAIDDYASELSALLSTLQAKTHARLYVGNLPDLTLLPYFADQNLAALSARIAAWNSRIAAICAASASHLVDLSAYSSQLSQHPEYIASDGLHPSTLGAEALAQVFARAIQQSPTA